jgi:hypothetical protein
MAASIKPLHSAGLRGVIIPALAVFVAVAWWAGRTAAKLAPDGSAPANPAAPSIARSEWPRIADGKPRSMEADVGVEQTTTAAETSFGTYVTGKYRFLFDDDLSGEAAETLRSALLDRERVAVAINTAKQANDPAAKDAIQRHQAELAALDRQIGALLPPADLAAFDVLKDSDVEQFQLDDYAGGVSAVAPLSDADKKAILYTKLTHRQRFRQVLADSGLKSGDLDAAERRQAFAEVSRALVDSRDHYLQEVRQYLYNDTQFTLLSNYENSEYTAELAKLRGIAYGETVAASTPGPG